MPRRLPKVCADPKCGELTDGGTYCPEHQPEPWAGSTRRERIGRSGSQQQAANKRTLRNHKWICHVCGKPGADEVDHVTPLAEGGTDTDDNRRPIHSTPCHQAKTQQEAARARRRVQR